MSNTDDNDDDDNNNSSKSGQFMALRYHDECVNKHSLLKLYNGFIWLRIGSNGGLLFTMQ